MSDVKNAYNQIIDFLNNETEKTLLLRGIADKEKHQALLKALNAQGNLKGLINLIHTSKDGMENFFRWAELYKVNVPKKYGQGMKLSNLTIFFDNLTTKSSSDKYDNYAFDFMIVWPIQSVTKNEKEIQMLKEMAGETSDNARLDALSDSIGILHAELKKLTYRYYMDFKKI